MIHARKDYAHIQDPSGKIPEDEPVFLIRGQDVLGPVTLEFWANKLKQRGGDPKMEKMVRDHADAMMDWQNKNTCKLPDL